MAKKADTSKYKIILADIASGLSVRKACEAHGVAERQYAALFQLLGVLCVELLT